MSSSSSSKPADDARSAFNIKVLKRHDGHITSIVYSASFVVLYQYSSSNESWSKTGIEGPMFLYRREIAPHYGMFVLNRNGVDNFSVSLTKDDELQLTEQFVILRTEEETILTPDEDEEGADETILGVWVFEKDQRVEVGKAMEDIQARAEREDEIVPPPPPSTQGGQQQQNGGNGSISLDALFSTTPQQPAASASTASAAGPALLDAIFQSASSTPKPAHAKATTSNDSTHTASAATTTDSSASASDLMAMLGLKDSKRANGHPVQAPPVAAPAPAPAPAPSPPHEQEAPFRETAAQLLDEQMASKSTTMTSGAAPPMAKGEFVREILSLIHVSGSVP